MMIAQLVLIVLPLSICFLGMILSQTHVAPLTRRQSIIGIVAALWLVVSLALVVVVERWQMASLSLSVALILAWGCAMFGGRIAGRYHRANQRSLSDMQRRIDERQEWNAMRRQK